MTNPVLVEVTRGDLVESVHRGAIAIADASGALKLVLQYEAGTDAAGEREGLVLFFEADASDSAGRVGRGRSIRAG